MDEPHVFIAGVIQGSEQGHRIVAQNYRQSIREAIESHCPHLTIYDPVEHHPGSLEYETGQARNTFYDHLELVRTCRVLIAYLPEASLGTAIEMWEANRCGVPVIVISPMRENWVVRILSATLCEDLGSFSRWVAEGSLEELLRRPPATTGSLKGHLR